MKEIKNSIHAFMEGLKESELLVEIPSLQFFGEGEGEGAGDGAGAGTGEGSGAGEGSGEGTGAGSGEGEGSGEGAGAGSGEGAREGTFSQEDVNNLIARETRKTQEKLLKQLGVEDFSTAKDGLAKFKEWQDSQKTEQEKLQDNFQKLQETLKNEQTSKADLEAKYSALKANVKPESVEDVVVLARAMVNEETTIEDAIKKVSEKYPNFLATATNNEGEGEGKPKPKFSNGEHGKEGQDSELDKWLKAFK